MGISQNLYACAVCEKSFSIAKSLVDHVNKIHVKSLPSKIERKKEMEAKIEPKKETKIEHKKENKTKLITLAPASNEQQKNCDTKVGKTKLQNKDEKHK